MTLHDVQRLEQYWRRHPPLTVLVACCAAALGVKLPAMDEPESKPSYIDGKTAHMMLGAINSMAGTHG